MRSSYLIQNMVYIDQLVFKRKPLNSKILFVGCWHVLEFACVSRVLGLILNLPSFQLLILCLTNVRVNFKQLLDPIRVKAKIVSSFKLRFQRSAAFHGHLLLDALIHTSRCSR